MFVSVVLVDQSIQCLAVFGRRMLKDARQPFNLVIHHSNFLLFLTQNKLIVSQLFFLRSN